MTRYAVDGHEFDDPDSALQGDGQFAPFYVFDIEAQDNLPGSYATREEAEAHVPINEKRKPNDLLWKATARRMGKPVMVCLYAQTREAARCQAAAHLQLDLGEEYKCHVKRIDQ